MLSESKQRRRARDEFRKAEKLAESCGFPDLHKIALSLNAQVSLDLDDIRGVQLACTTLLQLAIDTDDVKHEVCALHGQGVAFILSGEEPKGRKKLALGLRKALKIEDRDWIERCGVDFSRKVSNGTLGEPDIKVLKRRAKAWEKKGKLIYAGDLWVKLADHLSFFESSPSKAILSYRSAVNCYSQAGGIEDAVLALARIADCNEHLCNYEVSLEVLGEAESLAKSHRDRELTARAMNQKAILLEELGRFEQAASVLRKAIAIQRNANETSELQTSLHNIGEVLRKAEQYQEALDSLIEAEAIARSLGDIDSAICSAHSHGLVLEHMGDENAASQQFQACRHEAKNKQIWREYVHAWEAMANLAWCQKKRQTAITRYRRALSDAKKYHCEEMSLRIAGNLANALFWVDQPKKARRVLSAYEGEFSESINSYIYHAKLAEIHEDCREPDKALEQWRKGENSATAVGNEEYISYCSAGDLPPLTGAIDLREFYRALPERIIRCHVNIILPTRSFRCFVARM